MSTQHAIAAAAVCVPLAAYVVYQQYVIAKPKGTDQEGTGTRSMYAAIPNARQHKYYTNTPDKVKFSSTHAGRVYCAQSRSDQLAVAMRHVEIGFNVLAMGMDAGVCQALLDKVGPTGRVIAIDMGHREPDDSPTQSYEMPEGVEAFVHDPWDVIELLNLEVDFDCICADIMNFSGRDPLIDQVSLFNQYWRVLPSLRFIVAKSKNLMDIAYRFIDAKDVSLQCEGAMQMKLSDRIVCAVGVTQYRATIPVVVKDGDTVLEIGCQHGTTTKLIKEANPSGKVMGSDIGVQSIGHANKRKQGYDIDYFVMDVFDLHKVATLGTDLDVIYLDISGISGRNSLMDALSLVYSYVRLCPKLRTIVIKSRSLRDLTCRFLPVKKEPKKSKHDNKGKNTKQKTEEKRYENGSVPMNPNPGHDLTNLSSLPEEVKPYANKVRNLRKKMKRWKWVMDLPQDSLTPDQQQKARNFKEAQKDLVEAESQLFDQLLSLENFANSERPTSH